VIGGTGPFGFTWTPSTYLNDSTLQNPDAQGVMDTIEYYVTAYDSATGTTSQPDSVTVYVSPAPDDSITPANPATCPGDSVLLEANGGASSYSWAPDSTLTSNSGDTTYSVPDDDETIVLTATNSLGCTGTDTVTISVQSAPGEPIGTATPDTICQGDSSTITATGSGANVTYQVYDSATAGTYLGDTPLDVGPMSDSTYYIDAVLSGSGCSYPGPRDTVSVTVNPAPTAPSVSLSPDTLCMGDTTTISATGSGAGVTYMVYDDSVGGNYLGDASLDHVPDSSMLYYVEAVDSNGCSPLGGRVGDTVHVDSLPDVSITPSSPVICQGDTGELVGSGADTLNWSPNVDIDTTSGDTVHVYPSNDTTYTLTGIDTNGCMSDTSVTVSVDSAPTQPTVDIVPDTICQGDSAIINASGSGGSVVYQIYDDSVGGTYLGDASLTVAPMTDSVYWVEPTLAGGGCSYPGGRVPDTLTVDSAPPAPTLTAMPDTVCPGDSSVINASGSGAGVTYEIYGDPSGTPYLGDAPLGVLVDSTTDYYVSAIGPNGCDQLGGPDTVTVHTYPEPVADLGPDTTSCPGDTISLTASGGVSYNWSTGDSGASIDVAPDSVSSYWVVAQNAQGCTDSDSITVNVVGPSNFDAVLDMDTVTVDKSTVIDVFANDTGSIGDSAIISGPYQGSGGWTSGGIDYTAPGSAGTDSLTYVVCNLTCNNICDTALVNITIEEGIPELFIPNGISADGDGYNDTWKIRGLEAYPQNSVKIFNRWGDEVYRADPYENDWKGQSSTGGEVLEGTYYYVLDLGPNQEKKTGFIELRR
ncbi:MAG: gliding motility-associated C-terminal domain-containing protein, partial [Flavobacteriales bacterium]